MASNKRRIDYQVGFTADTTQLQQSVKQAVDSLNKLGTNSQLTTQLKEASQAALDLSNHLTNAFNKDTGKLDLITFNNSLKQSGLTLQDYANKLGAIGPTGEAAFLNVAQAITKAELPLKRSNQLMNSLWITMKNTVRWQITSSALHGFVGSLESAYGYSKDLDKSLNSIRIVTGKSNEEMKEFAKSANEAAQALSTTTTKYTDASLIYYQQGLNDEQVQGRTDTTIDMANVSGQSAEIASEQLTAIWNNFYDGSKSLRYYADAMVALGASTASSSDEIATGIQKFAAVANTVGLSYEYAAAALATLTANTREAPEVVGNALKTLFARIQGLSLGETLDDGTDMNKYSKALMSVGVNIKDVNGELKAMDQILDETAAKWATLNRDQQTALAQTVAGVRQYNQFVSLMESWEDFQKNLNTAINSEGALTEQAEIYAESWKAARDRVRASAEDIYDSLINPDFYIGIDNVLSPFLQGTADVIDALGGMQGVLSVLALLMNKVYGDKIAQSMRDMATNIGIMSGREAERARNLQASTVAVIEGMTASIAASDADAIKLNIIKEEVQLQGLINQQYDSLDANQRKVVENEQFKLDLLKQQNLQIADQIQKYSERKAEGWEAVILTEVSNDWRTKLKAEIDKWNSSAQDKYKINLQVKTNSNLDTIFEKIRIQMDDLAQQRAKMSAANVAFTKLDKSNTETYMASMRELIQTYMGLSTSGPGGQNQNWLEGQLKGAATQAKRAHEQIKVLGTALTEMGVDSKVVQDYTSNLIRLAEKLQAGEISQEQFNNQVKEFTNLLQTGIPKITDWAQTLVNVGSTLSRVSMALNSIQSLDRVFSDKDMSTIQRTSTALVALSSILPLISSGYGKLSKSLAAHEIAALKSAAAAVNAKVAAEAEAIAVQKANIAAAGLTLGLTALVAVISTVVISLKYKKEAMIESAQATIEEAKANKENADSNRDLVESMQEALQIYKENGENKEELDDITRKLADAYQIEGTALATLSGKYDDYDQVVKNAIEKRKQELQELLDEQKRALKESEFLLSDSLGDRLYIEGYNLGHNEERYAYDVINQFVDDKFFKHTPYVSAIGSNFTFSVDKDNSQEVLEFYDQINEALDYMRNNMSNTDLGNSGLYIDLNNLANRLEEQVNNYRELQSNIGITESELGIETTDVSNLESYRNYVSEIRGLLKDSGLKSVELENAVNDLTKNSINPAIREFRELDDTIQDIKQAVGDDRLNLDKIFTNDNYDKAILGSINWRNVTVRNFYDVYNLAKKVYDVTSQMADSKETIAKIEKVRSIIKKAKSELDREDLIKIRNSVDWGNEEKGIIEFSTFMEMTAEDKLKYYDRIIGEQQQAIVDGIQANIEAAQQQIETWNSTLSQMDAQSLARSHSILNNYEQLQKAYDDYHEALKNGTEDEFNFDNYGINEDLLFEGFDWDSFKKKTKNEIQQAIKDATRSERAEVTLEFDAKSAIKNAQAEIDAQNQSLEIEVRVNFNNQLSRIEGSVDGIVAVFEVIEKGVEQTTNEIGQKVWGISREAALAIEDIYPGFIANAELLRDGTFALTDDMYQAFFDSANGQLVADTKSKAGMLTNIITMLEEKKASAQSSLEIAQSLANGEIQLSQLSEEQKEQLLIDYVNGQRVANGEMLDDEIDMLTDSDENWYTLWDQISGYSADGADNMATNVANSTGLILQNLEKIRDAAYQACLQYSQIGSENPTLTDKIDTSAIFPTSKSSWKEHLTIDKGGDAFINSIADQVKNVTAEDFFTHGDPVGEQVGEYLVDYYSSLISQYDKQIGSAKIAQSKLLEGIDNAYDKLGKANKGSKDKSNIDKLKDLDDIEERYHEINRQIERQDDLLDDVGNNIERTYGIDKLKNYQNELEELNKQQANYNEKLRQAQEWLKYDAANLEKLFAPGDIIYDEKGEILNYTNLLYKAMQDYNEAILTADSEEVKLLDKIYEDRINALKKYEDSINKMREQEDKVQEGLRKIADNELTQIEYKLEIVLDAKSMRDALRDFDKATAETFNDALTHGLKVAEISKEQAQEEANLLPDYRLQYEDLIEQYNKAEEQVDRDRIMKDIQDLQGKVLGSASAIVEWANSIEDIIPEALSAAADRYSLFTNQLEHNNTVLETIKELYALQGVTYKTMDGFNRLQKNAQERLETQLGDSKLQKAWYDNAAVKLQEAQAALDSLNGDETDIRYDTYKKARDAYLEEFNEAQEAYLSSAQQAMEIAQQMYLDQIEKATYEFGQAVSNGVGLDLLQDKYDHFIEKDDRYFDKVNEAYQTASWYNKLQEDIDKATNNKTKEQLKALQEEIDLRREGGKLSQYDLDILEAKYKVLQAQMALEDAQNAKNKLQLVRDRQGNWNYQYTADPQQVADAEQDLLDAQNEWYNIAKQQVMDVTGEIISTWQECQDKIKEIYSDMTLTDQERSDRAAEIYQFYSEKIKYLEEEKNVAIQDMTEAADESLKNAAELTGADLTNIAGATAESIIQELDKMTTGAGNFEDHLRDTLDKADEDFLKYQDVVANVVDQTGTSLDKLNEETNKVSDSTDRLTDAGLDASSALWDMISAAQDAAFSYADLAVEVWGAVEALRALAAEQAAFNTSQSSYDGVSSGSKYDKNTDYDAVIEYGLASGQIKYGDKIYTELFNQRENKIEGEELTEEYYGNRGDEAHKHFAGINEGSELTGWSAGRFENDKEWRKKLHELGVVGYATGGYTGEFDNGKLAFLHEKELVLNQEDTRNILAAVEVMRQMEQSLFAGIEKNLDSGSLIAMSLMAQKLKDITIDPAIGALEQRVIFEEVNFPNVTDHNEIEEAFRNLTNDAAQYARLRKE